MGLEEYDRKLRQKAEDGWQKARPRLRNAKRDARRRSHDETYTEL